MFPEWHHAVPESAYFKVPETLKTFRMYPISRFVYVLHWLATRLNTTAKFSSDPTISFLRKSTRKDPPVKNDQNKAISVHVLWRSFRHRSTPVFWSRHQKINFLHYISVTAIKFNIVPVQRNNNLGGKKIPEAGTVPK